MGSRLQGAPGAYALSIFSFDCALEGAVAAGEGGVSGRLLGAHSARLSNASSLQALLRFAGFWG